MDGDSSTAKNTQQDDGDSKPPAKQTPKESTPEWRSVAMVAPESMNFMGGPARPTSLAGPIIKNVDVIDKESFFSASTNAEKSTVSGAQSNWAPTSLRPVPAFYPLERSTRLVEDPLADIVARVSEANRVLSIHAVYCDETATASLLTAENVEMQMSLWKTGGGTQPNGIYVELQRRKGDSIAFHRYSRHILDAAVGDFDGKVHVEKHGEDIDIIYSKKVQRMLSLENPNEDVSEMDNAVIAIEIAHGLLMKDRMDARLLGLESLCLLTDPNKTGSNTALIASRVVLLGTSQDPEAEEHDELLYDEAPFQEIRQTILSLVQLGRIGEVEDVENIDGDEEDEHMKLLHNLALAVLANALDVIENEDQYDETPEESKPAARSRLNSASSVCENFIDGVEEVTGEKDILKTLITELGKAGDKPHNACLSAKCIGSLCRASDKARRRAKELGAKTVVQTALEVGTRTHLKLEKECQKIMTTLTNPSPDEN